MANYLDTLSGEAKANAATLISQMKLRGITSPFTHAAVLAVVSKESGFIPKSENMNYTTAESVSKVFGIPLANAGVYVKNPKALGDYAYGPIKKPTLGNGEGEGYLYRGRGFNQLTGKANYKKYGDLVGVNLVANPDKLNDPKVASDVAIEFFKNGIKSLAALGKLSEYNATNINDFKTAKDSLGAIYHVNAGVGSTKAKLDADVTGGKAKAGGRIDDLLNYVLQVGGTGVDIVKKNLGKTIMIVLLLGVGITGLVIAVK
ncbi:MAG TPA: glycoside hydrolase family 19 protein [Bacteroidia bacterium]|nr:glycoside hydrolase family 19 protein [Bacteroidia bacterium]